jgi:hypothetical protein
MNNLNNLNNPLTHCGKPFLQGYLESIAKPTSRQKQALHWSRSCDYIISDRVLNINIIKRLFELRITGCNEAEGITQAEGYHPSIWVELQDGRAVVGNQVLCTGGISCSVW